MLSSDLWQTTSVSLTMTPAKFFLAVLYHASGLCGEHSLESGHEGSIKIAGIPHKERDFRLSMY